MKILLIASNIADTPYFVYPLGMSMIAGALQNAGHKTIQFDFLQSGKSLDALSLIVEKERPDVIGISVRNIDNTNFLNEQRYVYIVKDIIQKIRMKTKNPVVLGGSGFSILPDLVLRETGADYGIVGEGESLMVDFVNNAAKGVFPEKRCVRASTSLPGENISSPYYESDLMEFYRKKSNMASVLTKRGCEYDCVYCTYPFLEGTDLRCRQPKDVIDDVEVIVDKHKINHIFFTDSVFNDRHGHYLNVLTELKRRGVKITWTAFFRPELFSDEVIKLMKETGLKSAEIGADASTDTTLRGLKKPFLFKDVVVCNTLLAKNGIATAHYYMFGCPGETKETVLEGVENIKGMKNTVSFIFMGIRILPGTSLAQMAQEEGLISPEQELLEPVYYIARGMDKQWMEKTLTDAFSGVRNCIFPPDSRDSSLQFLHSLGYTGSLWEMLITKDGKRRRDGRRTKK